MKKIILALLCLVGVSAFAQDNIVDVVIDGKPAKMNVSTGVYTFTNGAPSSYNTNTTNTEVSTNVSNTTDGVVHTVSKGETLYSISKKYEISMAQIKSLNKLTSNVLSVNQQLKIGYNTSAEIKDTSNNSSNTVYTVKAGDTLYSIAKQANISVATLKQLNNLENNIISIGKTLKLK